MRDSVAVLAAVPHDDAPAAWDAIVCAVKHVCPRAVLLESAVLVRRGKEAARDALLEPLWRLGYAVQVRPVERAVDASKRRRRSVVLVGLRGPVWVPKPAEEASEPAAAAYAAVLREALRGA